MSDPVSQRGPHPIPAMVVGDKAPRRKCRGCIFLGGNGDDWENDCRANAAKIRPIRRYSDYLGAITPSWCPFLTGEMT